MQDVALDESDSSRFGHAIQLVTSVFIQGRNLMDVIHVGRNLIDAAYHVKPLIFIGVTFREDVNIFFNSDEFDI